VAAARAGQFVIEMWRTCTGRLGAPAIFAIASQQRGVKVFGQYDIDGVLDDEVPHLCDVAQRCRPARLGWRLARPVPSVGPGLGE
jgi:hypothetical protein